MIHRYIPYLTWDARNIAYLILYHEFKHGLQRVKKPAKRIKNNQFNIKWYLNRFLKAYYQATKLSHLTNIETRLDLILFRTNWFKNKEVVKRMIKSGLIKVNYKIAQGSDVRILPGDVIVVDTSGPASNPPGAGTQSGPAFGMRGPGEFGPKVKLATAPRSLLPASARGYTKARSLGEWYKLSRNKMPQNAAWLEINNNTRSLVMLKSPKFSDIPYPFNLHKFYV